MQHLASSLTGIQAHPSDFTALWAVVVITVAVVKIAKADSRLRGGW